MIVIYGCGQMGTQLALQLQDADVEVTVVDPDRGNLEVLSKDFHGRIVVGLGIDKDVLRRADIERAEAFAAVSRDINTNVMAAQVAKLIFNVPRVVARVENPDMIALYSRFGIEIISPTVQAAKSVKEMLLAKVMA